MNWMDITRLIFISAIILLDVCTIVTYKRRNSEDKIIRHLLRIEFWITLIFICMIAPKISIVLAW